VAAAIGALFVIVASVHGALGAARNDDWSYLRIAFDFSQDQRFHVDGWIQTMLVGHTLLAWPIIELFGRSILALQLLGVTAALVGIVCCYAFLRRFLSPVWSALACLTLFLGPVLASLAVSYMTDATSFAAQAATLLLGLRALESRSHSRWWLTAAASTGLLAFSIREYAIVAFLTVLAIALARSWRDRRERARLMWITVAFVGLAVVLLLWRRSLPGTISPSLDLRPGVADLKQLMRFGTTLGLFVSPVVFATSPFRALARAWAANRALCVAALVLGAGCLLVSSATLLGNYVTATGSYSSTTVVDTAPPVVPSAMFALARVLGGYALMVGLLILARALAGVIPLLGRRQALHSFVQQATEAPAPTLATLFSASLAVLYLLVIAATTGTFFDRYMIPLVPFVAAMLIVASRRYELFWPAPTLTAAAALAVYAAIGFVYVDAAATIDGAKWRAAERLQSAGFTPATINAGYEWFGLHQNDAVVPDWTTRRGDLWIRLFSPRPICTTVVLNGTDAGARRRAERSTVLFRTNEHTLLGRRVIVLALRGPDECTPAEVS
jgi:Dolichyl-phosphate-mannose-protein mannosyltransferase